MNHPAMISSAVARVNSGVPRQSRNSSTAITTCTAAAVAVAGHAMPSADRWGGERSAGPGISTSGSTG